MQKDQKFRDKPVDLEHARGKLEQLLREIEKEPVPERLLQLALRLQNALAEQRQRQGAPPED